MPKESQDSRLKRSRKVLRFLRKHYPDAGCTLEFATPHQLMVATILSAQCTDDRVNNVTAALFMKYRSIREFAQADIQMLRREVYSTGFHNNKARAIQRSAQELLKRHNGEIPVTLDELTRLTGVGRKTGSVILGTGFGLAEGIVVDTHVGRISVRLGFTEEKDPLKIERDLMRTIPKRDWIDYSHLLIAHGRAICTARKPECSRCFLEALCPSAAMLRDRRR